LIEATYLKLCFNPLDEATTVDVLPTIFSNPFADTPHPIGLLAVNQLKQFLEKEQDWNHNFGLNTRNNGPVIGKMFGVLVVQTMDDKLGFLAAFSGKLAGSFHHNGFVPPVFDSLAEGSALNAGMKELTLINLQIQELENQPGVDNAQKVGQLKRIRSKNSSELQDWLFDQYNFLNQAGEMKSLRDIFKHTTNSKPPSGAGECAAPKLLQFAFQHGLKPLSMAEFWWGLSPKSEQWKHGQFYPACRDKCEPILAHMLSGISVDGQIS
jgi:tRNA pseudouridine32 synthase / 23S rRNA pseudouridine746 synthase